jgi:hypothetical protein
MGHPIEQRGTLIRNRDGIAAGLASLLNQADQSIRRKRAYR